MHFYHGSAIRGAAADRATSWLGVGVDNRQQLPNFTIRAQEEVVGGSSCLFLYCFDTGIGTFLIHLTTRCTSHADSSDHGTLSLYYHATTEDKDSG